MAGLLAALRCGSSSTPPITPNDGGSSASPDAALSDRAPDAERDAHGDANTREDTTQGHDAAEDVAMVTASDAGTVDADAMETDGGVGSDDAETGTVVMGRSCAGLAATCGPAGTGDCCASSLVPGGTFNRGNDPMFAATVSDFRLDLYEITVGRFRNFLAAYPDNKPTAGSGRNPHDSTDMGWDPAWPLPADQAALIGELNTDRVYATWRDIPDANENFPINNITWVVAYAFCIWDGGRLPTEAEWNYAAAGGPEQRYYPWSNPPSSTTIDPSYAVYSTSSGLPPVPPVSRVGSRSPQGDGRWGHADLAGNLWEFTRDQLSPYVTPCVDCTSPEPVSVARPPTTLGDAIRGGGFYHYPSALWSGNRSNINTTYPEADIGARCARAP